MDSMKNNAEIAIIIPARYSSTRLPGKPLLKINGREMLLRVSDIATEVIKQYPQVKSIVATDDRRIKDFCNLNKIDSVMTPLDCKSGTERCLSALEELNWKPDFIINLQGDNPTCPSWFITEMIEFYLENQNSTQMITPCVKLSWQDLSELRENKKMAPYSGTTVILNSKKEAVWFSKEIIPAIRNEEELRETSTNSPVYRHVGLYGYSYEVLASMKDMKPSPYAEYEGLEQLLFLENGINIQMVTVDYRDRQGMSGVDAPEDLELVSRILQ